MCIRDRGQSGDVLEDGKGSSGLPSEEAVCAVAVLSGTSHEPLLEDSIGLHENIVSISPPTSLNVRMRPYQLDALSWMKDREQARMESFELSGPLSKHTGPESTASLLDAHPLWLQCKFEDPGCNACLLYTSPSPRDRTRSRMPSSA